MIPIVPGPRPAPQAQRPVPPLAPAPAVPPRTGPAAAADLLLLATAGRDPAHLAARISEALRGGGETQRLAALGMLPLPGAGPDTELLSGLLRLARHGTPAERAEALRCLALLRPGAHATTRVAPGAESPAREDRTAAPLSALPDVAPCGGSSRPAGSPADDIPSPRPAPTAGAGPGVRAWLAAAVPPARPPGDAWDAVRRRSFLLGAAAAVAVLYLRFA